MEEALTPGRRIGDRYKLESEFGTDDASSVWRCHDERLERQVTVRMFDSALDADHLQHQAGIAASLTHPRVVRMFDTGFDGDNFFTVSEMLPASLAWNKTPLDIPDAIDLGAEVAEALAYAHERGVNHGDLRAEYVLLSEQGAKVAGFALSGPALQGDPCSPSDDLKALGVLVSQIVDTRSKSAIDDHGLSRVVAGLRAGSYSSADRVVSDLRALHPQPSAKKSRRPSMIAVWTVAVTVLVIAGVVAATRLGARAPAKPTPTPAPEISGTPLKIASVADFDPLGDGSEGRKTVAKIYDGDPRTFWSTERYSQSADFSGLKAGAGVILDLGKSELVGGAQIQSIRPGCSFELRHAARRESKAEAWTTVSQTADAAGTTTVEIPATRSRWWLLWVTKLTTGVPGGDRAYACGISEIALYAP